jgi:NDP-sugar pyrophosphorylase family protein
MSKRAIVLAGGKGTRLRPYTVVLPKPLMPVGEYPILEVIVRQLVSFGFDHITMAVNHQADLIKAFFGAGEKWKVRIDYSLETQALSTIAPLCLVPDLPQDFLLLNGDVLTDLDLSSFYAEHVESGALFTVAAAERIQTIDYGVLRVDGSSMLSEFDEKPSVRYLVSMGVYAVSRNVLAHVPTGQPYGFDHLMRAMLAQNEPVHVRRYHGYWLDIGRPDDYMRAIEEFDAMRSALLPDTRAASA